MLFIDPVLLGSVDVTRPVLRCFELGMSEFVGSDAFEDENRDPTTWKPRRLSLSLQKRPLEHDSDSVKAKKPRNALQASNAITESEYAVPHTWNSNHDWNCISLCYVNLGGPSMINTERQREELGYVSF